MWLCKWIGGVFDDTGRSAGWFSAVGAIWSTLSSPLAKNTVLKETVFLIPSLSRVLLWDLTKVPSEIPIISRSRHLDFSLASFSVSELCPTRIYTETKFSCPCSCSTQTDLWNFFLYRSCSILTVEFVFIFIVLRRSNSLCSNDHAIIVFVLFIVLGIADEGLMAPGNRVSPLWLNWTESCSSSLLWSYTRMSTVKQSHPSHRGAPLCSVNVESRSSWYIFLLAQSLNGDMLWSSEVL